MTLVVGYSGTPLLKKLGVKQGLKALLIDVPEDVVALTSFDGWASCRPMRIGGAPPKGPFDYVHLFSADRAAYEAVLPALRRALADNGVIWASWPKKSSGVISTLSETDVRSLALKNGLVDVKVCAVSDIWSGLKLVIPMKDRLAERRR